MKGEFTGVEAGLRLISAELKQDGLELPSGRFLGGSFRVAD